MRRTTKTVGIDWRELPLGRESDTEIARRIGFSRCVVTAARNLLGIPRSSRHGAIGRTGVDWATVDQMDTASARDVARSLGVSAATVATRHNPHAFRRWRPYDRDGNPVAWPEVGS